MKECKTHEWRNIGEVIKQCDKCKRVELQQDNNNLRGGDALGIMF